MNTTGVGTGGRTAEALPRPSEAPPDGREGLGAAVPRSGSGGPRKGQDSCLVSRGNEVLKAPGPEGSRSPSEDVKSQKGKP